MGYIVFVDYGLPPYYSSRDIIPYLEKACEEMGWRCKAKENNSRMKVRIGTLFSSILKLDLDREITVLPLGYDYTDDGKQKKFEGTIINYMKSLHPVSQ